MAKVITTISLLAFAVPAADADGERIGDKDTKIRKGGGNKDWNKDWKPGWNKDSNKDWNKNWNKDWNQDWNQDLKDWSQKRKKHHDKGDHDRRCEQYTEQLEGLPTILGEFKEKQRNELREFKKQAEEFVEQQANALKKFDNFQEKRANQLNEKLEKNQCKPDCTTNVEITVDANGFLASVECGDPIRCDSEFAEFEILTCTVASPANDVTISEEVGAVLASLDPVPVQIFERSDDSNGVSSCECIASCRLVDEGIKALVQELGFSASDDPRFQKLEEFRNDECRVSQF